MKKLSLFTFMILLAAGAFAQGDPQLNTGHIHYYPTKDQARPGGGGGSNLVNHGGPVLVAPKVAFGFWGPSFASGGADNGYATKLQSFRTIGMNANPGANPPQPTSYIAVLAQYSSAASQAAVDMGGSANDKFDTSVPPTNVTDADVQAEVHKLWAPEDPNTLYMVFIPSSSYSSSGTSTSCGGPSLSYCAYHGHFTDGAVDVKYAIGPYPSCSGCQSSGFSFVQNAEHFTIHESRETFSDEDLDAWYDRRGNEADDKCAWSPTPFIDQATGFAYQYEWSNSAGGCVQH